MLVPKSPMQCQNLSDIRQGIDYLDSHILYLMSQRMEYVLNAARFKPDMASIPDPQRVASMLRDRRQWAEELGFSPEFTEQHFQQMIHWFIDQQVNYWQSQNQA